MSKNKLIEIKKLTKKFGKKIANKNLTFDIYKGEKIGIIGANGAGKTTFVEQLIGVSKPTSGTIKYNFEYKVTPQEKMGMQFQDSSYPEGLSVKDIIDFSLEIYGAQIDQDELNYLLEIFQVKDFYKTKVKGLSGGQQQKLNVLLAVAHNPEIVVLDEISTGLDISAREEILGYVEKIINDKKMTTILISHHMSEIERLCNRVVILKDGEVYLQDTISNIQKKYRSLNKLMRSIINNKEIKDANKI